MRAHSFHLICILTSIQFFILSEFQEKASSVGDHRPFPLEGWAVFVVMVSLSHYIDDT